MAGRLIGVCLLIACSIAADAVIGQARPTYGRIDLSVQDLTHISEPLRPLAVPIDTVYLDPRNARQHGRRNLDAIAGSLSSHGQQKPIVVDADGQVIAGNGTHQAAIALGWTHIAVVRSKLRGNAARSYAIADNRTTDLSTWEDHVLAETLAALRADDAIDQKATGFSDLEIDLMLAELQERPAPGDEDAAPPLPEEIETRARPGDLWRCGDHLLLVGDSTTPADVERLMDGGQADLVFTDPPYNMNYKSKALGGIANDHLDAGAFTRLVLGSCRNMQAMLRSGGSFYVCMGVNEYASVAMQLKRLGLKHQVIVWKKPSAGMGSQEFRPQFELILYGFTGRRADRTWHGARRASNLWEFDIEFPVYAREGDTGEGMVIEVDRGSETVEIHLAQHAEGEVLLFDGTTSDVWSCGRERGQYCHPTQKPVDLVRRAIELSSDRGGVVADLFTGSGTTMIAAAATGRRFRGVELDTRYADVILQRWVDYASQVPLRVADGARFDEVDPCQETAA